MFDKRNRGFLVAIMTIATIAFSGFMIMPIISMFSAGLRPTDAASPVATAASPQAELAAQAKGYELVLQREPENQTALKGLLQIRIQQGDVQGAIAPLEKLAKLNPNQAEYMVLLAQVKQRVGDREGSAQIYREVLTSHPGDQNALIGLVNLLMAQQRPEAALDLLQDTLKSADEANKIAPNTINVPAVQLMLGSVYADMKRYDEAIAVYDELLETSPQDYRPLYGKAVVLQQQGKTDEAKPLFVSAAAFAPAEFKDQINRQASGQSPSPTASPNTGGNPVPVAPASPGSANE